MEVHQHSHKQKKKWTHYFWEFLMLFLAVFCGFLAEYQLEHKIEKDREKVYMQNLFEDLKTDATVYDSYEKNSVMICDLIDTLVTLIKNSGGKQQVSKLAYTARMITAKYRQINPTERTYEQMKSSGHLRLIRKDRVANSVLHYYNSLKELSNINEISVLWISDYVRAMGKVFDGAVLFKILKEEKEQPADASVLLTEDRMIINELITSVQYFYGALKVAKLRVQESSVAARNLAELIKKEYHLQ
ncbi:MAG TPA: hypothetical protein VFP97_05580 [Chitinophagaceae bacterium]|nr:hypothetical protein [Chitinophagaceae bacterium]